MNNQPMKIAQGLAEILGSGKIVEVESGVMTDAERGWSGAEIRRIQVTFDTGSKQDLVLKKAALKERLTMKRLTEQGHANTPAAFSLDTVTNEPEWMAIEDVGRVKSPPPGVEGPPQVAKALAKIHARNMRKGSEMPWLPHADRAYWEDYLVRQISVDHFERRMEQSPEFRKEFKMYLPLLREKSSLFAREMAALYDEKESLTLTHGDIQEVDGSHIHYLNGNVYIIDFGWCHYAPFYIDLASHFNLEDGKRYYDELIANGISLSYDRFYERSRAAFRYAGLIYLYPSLMQWSAGPTERTGKRLLQMLKIILTGEFPERRIHYSNELFTALLKEHRNKTLRGD